MYINIGANNGSEKLWAEKKTTGRLAFIGCSESITIENATFLLPSILLTL